MFPLLRGGVAAPYQENVMLPETGRSGEIRYTHKSGLPRHAEAKVALHLFDRRGDPSSKEGEHRHPSPKNNSPCLHTRFSLKIFSYRDSLGSLTQSENLSQGQFSEVPMWTKPVYIELRLGFESTLYISTR
jgi:coenzyme PQQ precursor peptide PqqA